MVAATAQEQEVRWQAAVNLIALAALRGNELLFERHRQELAQVSLPPALNAYYHLYVGQGLRQFGRVALARKALGDAVGIASRYELNEIRFQAEELLAQIESAPAPATSAPPAPEPEVAEVIEAVRSMRELAGVSGD